MKVLMLCNIVPQAVSKELELGQETGGGWISSVISGLERTNRLEMCVCFPFLYSSNKLEMKIGETKYYGFKKKNLSPFEYDYSVEEQFRTIIVKEKPDIVHIFGTEFPHTLAMVKAFDKTNRTVIHIQGLVSVYARHYCAYLPDSVTKKNTLRDFAKQDNIIRQKRKFELRGEFETEALKLVGHVMGRTDWDQACCKMINPNVKYHYVQEMMRSEFYEGQWNYDNCEKYSIFMSQGSYPIKGLHIALEALRILGKKYPHAKLYVAGSDIIHSDGFMQKIRKTYYAKYVMDLIKKWDLENKVVFLGPLSADKMKERYLSSNVFISPSAIDNSPNSIGEAMLLGVPIVASDVGGVSSLITHKKNGFLYQADAPYMLAYYAGRIFEDSLQADKMSGIAKDCAKNMYARETVIEEVQKAYLEMITD